MQSLRWPTYAERGIVLAEAVAYPDRGSYQIRDADGKVYLDAIGGIGCAPIGHAHPTWVSAIAKQAATLAASANSFVTAPQHDLAAALCERFPIDDARVFFTNTGTESTEAAIKCALRATGRDTIVAFDRAFHGRTLAALSLTANPKYREPFLGCSDEEAADRFARFRVLRLPFNDLGALEAAFAEHGDRIAAVFLEPIQGEGGVYPATREFLLGARDLCTRSGALLGVDEIQSGVGRTGEWAAWTAIAGDEVRPDILWLAKALGGGFPIGACLASAKVAEHMTPGTHGTTFGGNPLACAAALATLQVIESEGLLAKARAQIGTLRGLAEASPIPGVKEIRGVGAMIGVQLGEIDEGRAGALSDPLMERGVLVTVPGGHTLRLLLPYFADESVLGEFWSILGDVVAAAG